MRNPYIPVPAEKAIFRRVCDGFTPIVTNRALNYEVAVGNIDLGHRELRRTIPVSVKLLFYLVHLFLGANLRLEVELLKLRFRGLQRRAADDRGNSSGSV